MSRSPIACMSLDLRQLDEVMIHMPSHLASLVRWLVASADLQRLTALLEAWSTQSNIIPCLVPDWSRYAEQCIKVVIEAEQTPGETPVVLHPSTMTLTAYATSAAMQKRYVPVSTCASPLYLASLVAAAVEGANA